MKQNPQEVAGRPKKFISKETIIKNTEENIRESEIGLEFGLPEERENIKDKNERRKHAIQRMKNEPLS